MSLLDFGAPVLAACVVAVIAGGLVKGVTGIGLPLVAMPILASFIPIPQGMALLSLPSIATSVWQSLHGGHFGATSRRLWLLFGGITVGVAASARMLAVIDLRVLYLILGAIVTAFASIFRRRVVFNVTPRSEPWSAAFTGVIAGLIGGVSMLFGPIYAMYLSGLRLNKDRFVVAVSLANLWSALMLALALAGYRLIAGEDLLLSLTACVPAFAGVLLGQKLRRHINEEVFRKALAVVLFLIGLNLIRKAMM